MKFIRSLDTIFKTTFLGHLSPAELDAVRNAQRALRDGWLWYDVRAKVAPRAIPKNTKKLLHFLDELDSGDPKRQRAILADADFQSCLAKEYERSRNLASVHYFQQVAEQGKVRSQDAVQLVKPDRELYHRTDIAKTTPEGEALRAEHFAFLPDDCDRLAAARFCAYFLTDAQGMPHTYEPSGVSEEGLRTSLIDAFAIYLSRLDDDEFEQTLMTLARLSDDIEPRRIMHYIFLFKDLQWVEKLREARQVALQKKRDEDALAETATFERERAEQAAVERKEVERRQQIEAQLTFKVEDETLDVSLYGWPDLTEAEDKAKLFANMKSAFARATKVRFTYLPSYGLQMIAERGIRSMSNRQLACVKLELWSDRLGVLKDEKYLGELKRQWALEMARLLNADGHAQISERDRSYEEFVPVLPELAATLKADIDDLWLMHAETMQKWISSGGDAAEMARWIVEDPNSSTGWATSR